MIFGCFQRADGWCESVGKEVRTGLGVLYRKQILQVDCSGSPPLKGFECAYGKMGKIEW